MTRTSAFPGSPGLLVGLLALFLVPGVRAGDLAEPPALTEPVSEIAGALVLGGGGPLPDAVRDRFLQLAGGKEARLVVLLAPKEEAAPEIDKVVAFWKQQNAASVVEMHTLAPDTANDGEF